MRSRRSESPCSLLSRVSTMNEDDGSIGSPTNRQAGRRGSLPHPQAVLLRKAPRQAAAFGRKWNDADFHLAVPVARSSPRSLNGSLLREDFSLTQSAGNLRENLGYWAALAREIYQRRSRNRIFPDLFPVSREGGLARRLSKPTAASRPASSSRAKPSRGLA
jgi:hypothetical protein